MARKASRRIPQSTGGRGPLPPWVLATALVALTLLAYAPAWHGEVLWDDAGHLTRTDLQGQEGLRRIWFEPGATQQYYPVVHTAFWVQHQLWGDSTTGYHLVGIVLHGLSAFMVGVILRRLGVPGAPAAAIIFALHPVHVESVAWISELKNTLSGFFYLGAALAYLRFDDSRALRPYVAAVALFVLALLSKSVTATLPVGLLVVLWWRRGRLSVRADVAPLLPFVAAGVAMAVVTIAFEAGEIGAQGADYALGAMDRILIAGRAAWFYVGALLWPSNLTFNYSRWVIGSGVWWQYLFPAALAGLLVSLWTVRGWSRGPLAAALFFLVTVAPALGFVNVYPFRFSFVADHFQYLASLGVITLVAAGLSRASGVVTLVVAVVLGVLTWGQSHQYSNAETLYWTTIAKNPASWFARNNLAALLLEATPGDPREALAQATESLRLRADNPAAHFNAGSAFEQLGDYGAAADHYRSAIAQFGSSDGTNSRLAFTHYRLGSALAALGRPDEAIVQYQRALVGGEAQAGLHTDLGIALAQTRRYDEALTHFREAARRQPASAAHLNNLGGILLQLDRLEEAAAQFEGALRLDPDLEDARLNLALVLRRLGRSG